jgi:hypothetical protein
MTKKDYKLIAQAIADTYCDIGSASAIVESIAEALEAENPLFNKTKFREACGVALPAKSEEQKFIDDHFKVIMVQA